jgi:hypothetical protein
MPSFGRHGFQGHLVCGAQTHVARSVEEIRTVARGAAHHGSGGIVVRLVERDHSNVSSRIALEKGFQFALGIDVEGNVHPGKIKPDLMPTAPSPTSGDGK